MIILLVGIMWLASAALSAYIMAKKVGVDIGIGWLAVMIIAGPIGLITSLTCWAENSDFVVLKGK